MHAAIEDCTIRPLAPTIKNVLFASSNGAPPELYGYSPDEAYAYVVDYVRRLVQDPKRINGNGVIFEMPKAA